MIDDTLPTNDMNAHLKGKQAHERFIHKTKKRKCNKMDVTKSDLQEYTNKRTKII